MSARIALTYSGEGFFPPLGSTFVHDEHEYVLGELMHMEVSGGTARSYVRAYNTSSIVYFEFTYDFAMNALAEDNVLPMRQLQKARA